MQHTVLQLDINGAPQAWISPQEAATYYASDSVAWSDGDGIVATLRGGWNAKSGRQSIIEVHPIIAVNGQSRINLFDVLPAFSRDRLFVRDRLTCAYCNAMLSTRELTVEHILPESRGGSTGWMNCVASCRFCNGKKANRTPEEANMPLIYLPYKPSLYESFLLDARHIRSDVHEWLRSRLPRTSRLN